MQPGRSRPRSGVRGGGLWGPLHPYAALATSAFAAGTRFRAQAAAGRPRNAPTAQLCLTLGVFEILGASAAPFACIGGVCLIVPLAAGTRFRALAAAGRPRNVPTAQSRPILGVFEILGASAGPFPCIGYPSPRSCHRAPSRGRCTIPGASRSRAAQERAHRPFGSHSRSV